MFKIKVVLFAFSEEAYESCVIAGAAFISKQRITEMSFPFLF